MFFSYSWWGPAVSHIPHYTLYLQAHYIQTLAEGGKLDNPEKKPLA